MTQIDWTAAPGVKMTVDGVALEYACWGPAPDKSPTLVLLHEGLGCVALWRDFPQKLAAATGLGVFVYSRAGYGASDPITLPRPLDYMTLEADVLGKVLDGARIKQAVLYGHSDGASIAAIYVGSAPDMRVRGLVLEAPHFFTEPSGLAAIKAAGEAFEIGTLREKLAKYHADVEGAFKGWHGAWGDPDFASWSIADAIDHWRIPVLAIQGRDDPYGSLAQIVEIEERIYSPFETLALEGCGHAPHAEAADQTLESIREFCATLMRLEREEVAFA